MSSQPAIDPQQVIAEGVDEEPVEKNRRLYTGAAHLRNGVLGLYAAFHMAALNGFRSRP